MIYAFDEKEQGTKVFDYILPFVYGKKAICIYVYFFILIYLFYRLNVSLPNSCQTLTTYVMILGARHVT